MVYLNPDALQVDEGRPGPASTTRPRRRAGKSAQPKRPCSPRGRRWPPDGGRDEGPRGRLGRAPSGGMWRTRRCGPSSDGLRHGHLSPEGEDQRLYARLSRQLRISKGRIWRGRRFDGVFQQVDLAGDGPALGRRRWRGAAAAGGLVDAQDQAVAVLGGLQRAERDLGPATLRTGARRRGPRTRARGTAGGSGPRPRPARRRRSSRPACGSRA